MKPKRLRVLFILVFCFLGGISQLSGRRHSHSRTINVGFVADLPPYVMGETGILVDMLREALDRSGYRMRVYLFSSKQFEEDPLNTFEDLDIFVGTPAERRSDYNYFEVFEFEDIAVSGASSHLEIHSVDDLRDKRIVAFDNAGEHLKELKQQPGYREAEDRRSPFAMLASGQAQVVLMDRNAAYYYAGDFGLDKLVFHEIFPMKRRVYAVSKDERIIQRLAGAFPVMYREGWVDGLLAGYR